MFTSQGFDEIVKLGLLHLISMDQHDLGYGILPLPITLFKPSHNITERNNVNHAKESIIVERCFSQQKEDFQFWRRPYYVQAST